MNLVTRMLLLLAVSSSLSAKTRRQSHRTYNNRKHQERRDPLSLPDAGSCNVNIFCYWPCDNIVYQIYNKVCGSRKGCRCDVLVLKTLWSERCDCRKGSFVSRSTPGTPSTSSSTSTPSTPSTPNTTVLTAAAGTLVGTAATSRTCVIIGIVCAVVAFFLGVILSLAVVFLRRKKANRQHEEPSRENEVSEIKAQLKEASDHREDIHTYYLRKEPDTSNDNKSVIESETSPDVLPKKEDSDAGVCCHLGVVSEAKTRENTSLMSPDHDTADDSSCTSSGDEDDYTCLRVTMPQAAGSLERNENIYFELEPPSALERDETIYFELEPTSANGRDESGDDNSNRNDHSY
ncbi:uncharacterized protein LOC112559777 isoform X2 [Pomacea canaliculata]|uniref:uncharacterized protein LOC112559777 isoform X2 n=1 Tax=Pomacea canaliculata TaxID=400727 RepID=UPI000D73439B|nr:uncharacterized protein LOC112559777 isoform X2 [Pomacea canaliculata]